MSPAAVELVKRGLEDPSAVTHFLRKKVIRKTWPIWQSFGFHVVPNHFYYPIPDTDDLRRKQPWNETYPTAGIDLREDRQLELLDECRDYFAEYTHPEREAGFVTNGDGPMLYAMVRKFEPDRIIEVGSGESTAVTLAAARKNEQESGTTTEITAIEPYPDEALRELARGNDGLTVLESRAVTSCSSTPATRSRSVTTSHICI